MNVVRVTLGALILALASLWPARAYAVPIPWKNCGRPGDVVSVSKADASVWPPQSGKSITIVIQGTVAQAIHTVSGSFRVTYTPPGRPPLQFGFSWFNAPANIPAGPFSVNRTLMVPRFIAPGTTIGVHFQESLPTGQGVVCVDATVPFK
jgi:hypothetical protein